MSSVPLEGDPTTRLVPNLEACSRFGTVTGEARKPSDRNGEVASVGESPLPPNITRYRGHVYGPSRARSLRVCCVFHFPGIGPFERGRDGQERPREKGSGLHPMDRQSFTVSMTYAPASCAASVPVRVSSG